MANTLNLKEKLIDKFFEDDYLDFTKYPDKEISEYYSQIHRENIFDFTKYASLSLAEEMKVFIKMVFLGFNGYTYTSNVARELPFFTKYLQDKEYGSVLDENKEDFRTDYLKYRTRKYNIDCSRAVDSLYFAMAEYHDKREGLDRDIWYLDELSLSEERVNKVAFKKTINFYEIKNPQNRELIKKFIRYQLGSTELALSTIIGTVSLLRAMSNYYQGNLLDFTTKDYEDFEKHLRTENRTIDYTNRAMARAKSFFSFLIAKGIFTGANPFNNYTHKGYKKKINTAIPDHVIFQIFNNLKLAPFNIMVMFVINYATGMRVSDICQLETGCTFTAKNHYFIKHKVQKMKKFQANIIPKADYELILQQEAIAKKDNPKGKYLFPSPKDKDRPISTQRYRNTMKDLCNEWGIKNEDGTPYEFKSHAYRHTIATTLLNDFNVDLSIIQLGVLGHQEINMSLFYAERHQPRQERFQKAYVSIDGSVKRISDEVDDVFLETAKDLAESLDKMQLPNGLCLFPRKLEICPHFDACLSCQFFRTSLDYLELHKQQLASINRNIPIYEANNWLPNLATAKKEKEGLERIITALEKLKQEGGLMNGS